MRNNININLWLDILFLVWTLSLYVGQLVAAIDSFRDVIVSDVQGQPKKLKSHSTKTYYHVSHVKGNMHTISPGRNRVNFQILAYLLTIDLLYGTGCLSY